MSGTQQIHLDILTGDVTFKVSVNASANQQENIDLAVQIAQKILKLCE